MDNKEQIEALKKEFQIARANCKGSSCTECQYIGYDECITAKFAGTALEKVKKLFDAIQALYRQSECMKDSSFKAGSLDALNNVLDLFHQHFGMEVDE